MLCVHVCVYLCATHHIVDICLDMYASVCTYVSCMRLASHIRYVSIYIYI